MRYKLWTFKSTSVVPGTELIKIYVHDFCNTRLNRLYLDIMECCRKKKLLMILSSASSCAAFGLLCISVATDFWLHTMERIESTSNNKVVLYRCSYSGLFRKCVDKYGSSQCSPRNFPTTDSSKRPVLQHGCEYIDYFTQDIDRDSLSPTDAILLTIRRSTFFPLSSLVVLIIGCCICFIGHCYVQKKVLVFVAGVFFVLSGLCTLVGLILYISSITGEVGNKPRQKVSDPKFIYYYGSSFMLAVGAFALMELAGVLSVYLFAARHKHERRKFYEKKTKSGHKNYNRSEPVRERSANFHNTSFSRSDSYFTYNQMSDNSREMSSYTFPRDLSRHTISTTADTHLPLDASFHSFDKFKRTTPV